MSKVLVTGATGFVGANLARHLLKEGYDVHIFVRATSNLWRIEDIATQMKIYILDLLEKEKVYSVVHEIRPTLIFHLATAGIYGGVHPDEYQAIDTNLVGTINLINACNDIDYKCFVNTGSSSEYGKKKNPMKEDDICEPNTIYGITKLAATLYAVNVGRKNGKPIVTLRLFSPYGPYDDSRRLISYVISNSLRNKPLSLSNPNSVRDYIFIDDVIEAYMSCIQKADYCKGETFNIGSGVQRKISEVVEIILQKVGSNLKPNWGSIAGRDYEPEIWQADITKARKHLNWHPKYRLEEGLERTINWFKDNLSHY
ncbi:MAG: GDP-mannose 4,6-dehydratase [Thermoplasmata archaeon]